jgi:predicted AAA+ superfamily ATPase
VAHIEREIVGTLQKHLRGPANLLQVVVGPRQVGKTTAVHQLIDRWKGPSHYASADLPAPPAADWISAQWQLARGLGGRGNRLLVLDEVQKVPRWSEVVKSHVDEDRRRRTALRVVVLGSSSLLVRHGLTESLAGRFELHHAPHWSLGECRRAFGWDLDRWLYFGGYPGAAPLARSRERWASYVRSSLIETVLSRDVLLLAPVAKPALLRQLFGVACQAHAEILPFNKMLGQLQDAGNTVTLAHYLELLEAAYLVTGLPRWSPGKVRLRASSPKLVVWNNALVTAMADRGYGDLRGRPDLWGRLVENAVGAHLLAAAATGAVGVHYWREGADEVDFVLSRGDRVLALEVKSGRPRPARGLAAFQRRFPTSRTLVVGTGGVSLEKFFERPAPFWISAQR